MLINCPGFDYKKFIFAAGELHLILDKSILEQKEVDIEFKFTNSENVFELLLLSDTLYRNKIKINNLILRYIPFGQADRVNEPGECFSLRLFCDLINNVVRPDTVTVYDPHSDVAPALLNNCKVVHQWEIFAPIIKDNYTEDFVLVSPDAGSEKKVNKLAQLLDVHVVYCRKIRSTKTGEILYTDVGWTNVRELDAIIIDDQCVGGKTFIEIAKVLRDRNVRSVVLMTTNGIYSQGLSVFEGLIDVICNQYRRVK